jgi:hypothetical protein
MESHVPLAVQFNVPSLFWVIVAMQTLGLLSAWLARYSVGSRSERSCQWLFFSCLTLVGCSTVVAMSVSAASWLFCAGTLALMVIAVVYDFGGDAEAETV